MATDQDMHVEQIPIDLIDVGEQLIRHSSTGEGLQELMLDIARNGLLQPIGVAKKPDGRYQLLYGYRRLTACRSLHWRTIPAVIRDAHGTDDVLLTALRENVQRSQMTFEEEANVVRRLQEEFNMSTSAIAEYLNRSIGWVQKRLAFFSFPPDVVDALRADKISYGVAEKISLLTDDGARASVLQHAIVGQWNETQVRAAVESFLNCPSIEHAVEAGLQAYGQIRSMQTLFACEICSSPTPMQQVRILRICPECDATVIPELHNLIAESSKEQTDAS